MKIESSKNQTVDKKETKNVFKTETSVFNSSNPLKPASAAPADGAFAKILEETRRDNEKNNPQTAKTDAADHDSNNLKSERDEKTGRAADEKKELEERRGQNGDGDASQNSDENQAQTAALAALQSAPGVVSDTTAPAARSILHVADLERIIATIRSETFQNRKQVVIALKNSVLQGLQIKLTLDANGKLKAEFLALDEQIKRQLERRKKELSDILHQRAVLFSEIEITAPD